MRIVRWAAMALALTAICGALLMLLVVFDGWGSLFDSDEPQVATARERSEIAVSTLSATVEAAGTLEFDEVRSVAAGQGTLTAIAAAGQAVQPGDVLFEVDGEPTVALAGAVPGWRTMQSGDVGPDVLQLEQNLSALGYDSAGLMTVDETFTDYTATLVERWQEDLGLPVTGRVEQASVIFVPTPAAITTASASPGLTVAGGATGSSTVLTVSTADRLVSFAVQPGDLDTITVGSSVRVRLPDRATVNAIVDQLSSNGDGSWTVTARPVDTEPGLLPDGEVVPVDVSWNSTVAEQVKTVRANAITRLDDGSYVVEVLVDDGLSEEQGRESTEFVAVEIGAQSGSLVEIRTDLEPGTVIIAP